jgi:cytosine/adenosine deaminase-related metal-dependent hydrolase
MASSILLRNGTVLSHDGPKVVVLRNHDILVKGNTIDQIGQNLTLQGEGLVIDCTDKIISPGFIDTHHHLWQTQVLSLVIRES